MARYEHGRRGYAGRDYGRRVGRVCREAPQIVSTSLYTAAAMQKHTHAQTTVFVAHKSVLLQIAITLTTM